MKKLFEARLDGKAEPVRQSHAEAIVELQGRFEPHVIRGLEILVNNTKTFAHRLGRKPLWVGASAIRFPRSAALIAAPGTFYDWGEQGPNGEPIDRTRYVTLSAAGFTSAGSFLLTFDLLLVVA